MEGDKVLYDRNWRAPDSVAEVVEAVHNLTVAVFMIRNYSFEVGFKTSHSREIEGTFTGISHPEGAT